MTVARNTATNQSKASRFAIATPFVTLFAKLGQLRTKPATSEKPVHGYNGRSDWNREFNTSSSFADSIRGF